MPDITFTITRRELQRAWGTLRWAAKNLESRAVSGQSNKPAIPVGLWKAPRRLLLDKPAGSEFCDAIGGVGHCWFQAFENAHGRSEVGIHPDGGVRNATLGCIGILDDNTKSWYDAFYAVPAASSLAVEVLDKSRPGPELDFRDGDLSGLATPAAGPLGGLSSSNLSAEICAEVVFGETSALRAPGQEQQLADGRAFIAGVAYARYLSDPSRFAPRQKPTPEELADPAIKRHWELCQKAAKDGKTINVGNCLHFVIWPINDAGDGPTDTPKISEDPGDQWPYTEKAKIKVKYGPFKSYVKPVSEKTYVFRYCGVA